MDICELDKYFDGKTYIASSHLKHKLIQYRIKEYKYERCKQTEWLEMPIPLELHHVDGNHSNNSLSNLEILCPNCHSLTHNHRGKKKNKNRVIIEQTEDNWKPAIISSPNAKQAIEKMGLKGGGSNYMRLNQVMAKHNLQFRPYTLDEKRLNRLKRISKLKGYRLPIIPSLPIIPKIKQTKWFNNINLKELTERVWQQPVCQIENDYNITGLKMFLQRRNIPTPPPGYWRKLKTGHIKECNEIKEKLVGVSGLEPPLKSF